MKHLIQLREIQENDNLRLKQIIQNSLEACALNIPGTAYFDPELEALSNYYQAKAYRQYFVLTDEQDQVVGGVGIGEYDLENGVAELQKLYLCDTVKGKGYSYLLMTKAMEFAEKAGYTALYLETHHRLRAAISLYEKLEFQRINKPLVAPQHDVMDHFYLKKLRNAD